MIQRQIKYMADSSKKERTFLISPSFLYKYLYLAQKLTDVTFGTSFVNSMDLNIYSLVRKQKGN